MIQKIKFLILVSIFLPVSYLYAAKDDEIERLISELSRSESTTEEGSAAPATPSQPATPALAIEAKQATALPTTVVELPVLEKNAAEPPSEPTTKNINNSELVKKLISNDYKTFIAPPEFYEAEFSGDNKNLPKTYFRSWYLKEAFESVKSSDILKLRYFIDNFNFLNIQDLNGNSLLHQAVVNQNYEIAALLVAKNIEPNLKNKDGYTALNLAIMANNYKVVKLILSGLKSRSTSNSLTGKSDVDYAYLTQDPKMIDLINSYAKVR